MTDDQLRALVRDVVARQLAAQEGGRVPGSFLPQASPVLSIDVPASHDAPADSIVAEAHGGLAVAAGPGATVQVHVSHAVFMLPAAIDGTDDGPCRTEPEAGCTRCGFCQSLGY